jgi:hypothetical protein
MPYIERCIVIPHPERQGDYQTNYICSWFDNLLHDVIQLSRLQLKLHQLYILKNGSGEIYVCNDVVVAYFIKFVHVFNNISNDVKKIDFNDNTENLEAYKSIESRKHC